ncbi:hypothetical protein [Streptomyces sp. NPDC002671]
MYDDRRAAHASSAPPAGPWGEPALTVKGCRRPCFVLAAVVAAAAVLRTPRRPGSAPTARPAASQPAESDTASA